MADRDSLEQIRRHAMDPETQTLAGWLCLALDEIQRLGKQQLDLAGGLVDAVAAWRGGAAEQRPKGEIVLQLAGRATLRVSPGGWARYSRPADGSPDDPGDEQEAGPAGWLRALAEEVVQARAGEEQTRQALAQAWEDGRQVGHHGAGVRNPWKDLAP